MTPAVQTKSIPPCLAAARRLAGAGAGSGGGISASRGPATQPTLSANGGQLYLAWIDNEFPSAPTNTAALYAKYWNGSAFVEQVPGDARFNGVSNRLGIVQSLALTVAASGHPFLAWSELDSGNSQIDVIGNTFNLGAIHYVNDSGTNGDTFSSVPGNDAGDGLSPTAPSRLSKECSATRLIRFMPET